MRHMTGFPQTKTKTPGAKNAGLLAVSILALHDDKIRAAWEKFRARQTRKVQAQKLPK